MSEEIRGSTASLFWSSDKPIRDEEAFEAQPIRVFYQCGRCHTALNEFKQDGYVRCAKNHLNYLPGTVGR